MEPAEFELLVENVKKDGKLTSVPLACLNEDGTVELLSGHHRSMAAIEAGFEEITVEVILNPLDEERKRAIQLSHNSIAGKDNQALLQELWSGLSLDAKKYSGLTEDDLGDFGDIKIDGVGAQGIRYQELTLMFLPSDIQIFEEALKTIKATETKVPNVHVAQLEAFEQFFEAIVKTKEVQGVNNSALALTTMAELALQRLEQIEAEQLEEADEPEPAKPNGHDKAAKSKRNGNRKPH